MRQGGGCRAPNHELRAGDDARVQRVGFAGEEMSMVHGETTPREFGIPQGPRILAPRAENWVTNSPKILVACNQDSRIWNSHYIMSFLVKNKELF